MRTITSTLAALALFIACVPADATTWAPVVRECPVCGGEAELEAIASYGGYIYSWPSKFQLVFWPHTADHGVYHCPHCHFSCFMEHWTEVDPAVAAAITAALAEAEVDDEDVAYHEIPILQRLALAEAAYAERGMDDAFWCFFHRVKGYHLEEAGRADEAAAARREALALAESLLAKEEPGAPRRELQFVVGSMKHLLGDEAGGKEALAAVATTPLTGAPGTTEADLSDYGEYLDSLAAELLGAPPPASAAPVEKRETTDIDVEESHDLQGPRGGYVHGRSQVREGFPAVSGGPKDLVRREAWVEKKLARPAPSQDERLALMADMARRYEEAADQAFVEAYGELTGDPDTTRIDAHHEDALRWVERAVAEVDGHPWRPALLRRQGVLLLELDRGDEVLEIALLLIEEVPETAEGQWAAVTLAEIYFEADQMTPAIDAYRIAEKGPELGVVLYATYKRAWCHYNLGELDEAVAALDAVIAGATSEEFSHLAEEAARDRELFVATQ